MAPRPQGSGSAEWMVVGVFVAVHCCSLLASAATLVVGGTQGWTFGLNYTAWESGQTFATGDVLQFPYTKGAHDVVEVNKASYDACTAANAISTYTDGNTNITFTTAGTFYFLCSFPGHCTAGMRLAITVGAGATVPAPPPTPAVAPILPPTPANTTAPVPAPAPVNSTTSPPTPVPSPASVPPAPVPTPASTPTPTPTPSPAPLSSSPASTATPAEAPPSLTAPSPPSPSTTPPSPPSPSTTSPNSAPPLSFSATLATVLLGLGGAFLAL